MINLNKNANWGMKLAADLPDCREAALWQLAIDSNPGRPIEYAMLDELPEHMFFVVAGDVYLAAIVPEKKP